MMKSVTATSRRAATSQMGLLMGAFLSNEVLNDARRRSGHLRTRYQERTPQNTLSGADTSEHNMTLKVKVDSQLLVSWLALEPRSL